MLSPDQEGRCVSYQGTLTVFSYPSVIYLDRKSTSKIYKSFLKQFEVTISFFCGNHLQRQRDPMKCLAQHREAFWKQQGGRLDDRYESYTLAV